jgi:DNA-binding HxlR family transcriptional regulator
MRKETSTNYQNEQSILAECPFSRTLEVLGNRWRPVVLWKLLAGWRRFSELRREIPPITEKMLAQELRELERRHLITRAQRSERPLQVEYGVTPLGQSLEPLLRQMFEWGERHAKECAAEGAQAQVSHHGA